MGYVLQSVEIARKRVHHDDDDDDYYYYRIFRRNYCAYGIKRAEENDDDLLGHRVR